MKVYNYLGVDYKRKLQDKLLRTLAGLSKAGIIATQEPRRAVTVSITSIWRS